MERPFSPPHRGILAGPAPGIVSPSGFFHPKCDDFRLDARNGLVTIRRAKWIAATPCSILADATLLTVHSPESGLRGIATARVRPVALGMRRPPLGKAWGGRTRPSNAEVAALSERVVRLEARLAAALDNSGNSSKRTCSAIAKRAHRSKAGLVGPRLTAVVAFLKRGRPCSLITIREFPRDVLGGNHPPWTIAEGARQSGPTAWSRPSTTALRVARRSPSHSVLCGRSDNARTSAGNFSTNLNNRRITCKQNNSDRVTVRP